MECRLACSKGVKVFSENLRSVGSDGGSVLTWYVSDCGALFNGHGVGLLAIRWSMLNFSSFQKIRSSTERRCFWTRYCKDKLFYAVGLIFFATLDRDR